MLTHSGLSFNCVAEMAREIMKTKANISRATRNNFTDAREICFTVFQKLAHQETLSKSLFVFSRKIILTPLLYNFSHFWLTFA